MVPGYGTTTVEKVEEDVVVRPIGPADAGEVLTLQRAAFVQEALIYGTPNMPPLTQTLDEVEAELQQNDGCVAYLGPRMVGAVRARRDGDLLLIGRLAIAPDMQGRGIGSRLLAAVEGAGRDAGAREAALFTGALSGANPRLFDRQGYGETERVARRARIQEVFPRQRLV